MKTAIVTTKGVEIVKYTFSTYVYGYPNFNDPNNTSKPQVLKEIILYDSTGCKISSHSPDSIIMQTDFQSMPAVDFASIYLNAQKMVTGAQDQINNLQNKLVSAEKTKK